MIEFCAIYTLAVDFFCQLGSLGVQFRRKVGFQSFYDFEAYRIGIWWLLVLVPRFTMGFHRLR